MDNHGQRRKPKEKRSGQNGTDEEQKKRSQTATNHRSRGLMRNGVRVTPRRDAFLGTIPYIKNEPSGIDKGNKHTFGDGNKFQNDPHELMLNSITFLNTPKGSEEDKRSE